MKPQPLARCTPEEIGLSGYQAAACIRALAHDKTTMNGFMAARYGKVFAECWWAPYRRDIPHSNHSYGKSYTAAAIGIALGEGLVRLDEKMADIFADEIQERGLVLPAGVEKITVEHVLTMTNGMAYHPDMQGDFITHYFSTPLAWEPGTHFAYNSTGSCMLGAIILKRTGQNLKEYLTPRLFIPIGIDPDTFIWRQFRDLGIDAEPGTFATTEANLRLALLYLQGGRWNGKQVIPEEYVRASLSVHADTRHAPEQKDGLCGYGYQLWACSIPGVYRFDGGQGQYGIIWPEKGLTVAIHEGALAPEGPQKTLDILYDTLLTQLADQPLPADPLADQALLAAQTEACLPPDPVSPLPPDSSFSGRYTVTKGCFDPWFSASPPGNGDLFVMFRTPELDIPVEQFGLEITPQACMLDLGLGRRLTASWDGSLTARFTPSPFDPLGDYAATARCLPDGTLEIHIHWLNGWFETHLQLRKTSEGLHITTRKLRLNESDNYLIYQADAVR